MANVLPFKSGLYVPTLTLNKKIPIVYRDEYNVSLFNVEKLYTKIDWKRWKKAIEKLKLPLKLIFSPPKATIHDLKLVHGLSYLEQLEEKESEKASGELIAYVTGINLATFLPKCLRRKLLDSFKYQTGGSVLAGKLAMERGWSINMGGGFHHASGALGGRDFCFYADVTLLIHFVIAAYPERVKTVLVVNLDAHLGNGVAYDFGLQNEYNSGSNRYSNTSNNAAYIYVLDIYNKDINPRDNIAKNMVDRKVELSSYTGDAEYLEVVEKNVERSLNEFCPNFVVYIAGTSIMKGDSSGQLSVSGDGIVARDEIVFKKVVRERNIPMATLMCGGQNAEIFATSIMNLSKKKLIDTW